MLYSKYCEYVIRALSYLSLHNKRDEYIMVKEIAEETNIPYHFLSKIFQNLATTKWVESKKGKKGGFTIAVEGKTISLMDIIDWSDGINTFDNCVLGERECGLDTQCKLQKKCTELRKDITNFFKSTTIQDVSERNHDIDLTENVNSFIATKKAL